MWAALLGTALAACLTSAPFAHATVYTWEAAVDGYFTDPTKWVPNDWWPDDASDRVIFDKAGTYTVRVTAPPPTGIITNQQLDVVAGAVTLDLETSWGDPAIYELDPLIGIPDTIAATVGTTAEPLTKLLIGHGGEVAADGALWIARDSGTFGRVELGTYSLGGADWTSTYPTIVGVSGSGGLWIHSGTLTNGLGVLGNKHGSSGAAAVYEGGSWVNTGALVIGEQGAGLLMLLGGEVSNEVGASIGMVASSNSGVLVTSGTWNCNASLYVGGRSSGAGGTGSITFNGDGTVNVAEDMTIWSSGTVTVNDGVLEVLGSLTAEAGSDLKLAGGKLSTGIPTFSPAPGTFNWTSGELHCKTTDVIIDSGQPLGPSLSLGAGKELTAVGGLYVGTGSAGSLSVSGGALVESATGQVGARGPVSATATLQGAGTRWTMTGDLTVRSGNSAHLTVEQGATLANDDALVASVPGTTADVDLSGTDTEWNSTGSVYLGGDVNTLGGSGTLDLTNHAAMDVGGSMTVWDNFDVTLSDNQLDVGTTLLVRGSVDVADSTLTVGSLEVTGSVHATGTSAVNVPGGSVSVAGGGTLVTTGTSAVNVPGGSVSVAEGGTLVATITSDPATQVTLQDAGSSWSMTGPLEIATTTPGSGHIGTLTLGPDTSVTATGTVEVLDNSALILGGGTINAPVIQLADNDFVGLGTLHGDVEAGGNVIAAGNLTIGNPASYTGVQIEGNLVVGPHTVTVNKAGFFNIGLFTDVSGGTLNVPGGVAIPVGNSLVAFGTINGRIAAQSGSIIEATGNLSLGDAASPAGFFSDGELSVHDHTVTLHDANQALLGSLTTLGEEGSPGMLVAANGAVVEFGKNVVGFGTLDTPNDPTRPLINNGAILGNSGDELITLNGFVKGVGTFGNVMFNGTFSPGFSPAAVSLEGDLAFGPAAVLEIELGGTRAGSQYDVLDVAGSAALDGTLQIDLIDGFVPSLGDTFAIMDFGAAAGDFDRYRGLDLGDGLRLQPSWTSNRLTLSTVPEPPTLVLATLAALLLLACRGRSRQTPPAARASCSSTSLPAA